MSNKSIGNRLEPIGLFKLLRAVWRLPGMPKEAAAPIAAAVMETGAFYTSKDLREGLKAAKSGLEKLAALHTSSEPIFSDEMDRFHVYQAALGTVEEERVAAQGRYWTSPGHVLTGTSVPPARTQLILKSMELLAAASLPLFTENPTTTDAASVTAKVLVVGGIDQTLNEASTMVRARKRAKSWLRSLDSQLGQGILGSLTLSAYRDQALRFLREGRDLRPGQHGFRPGRFR